MSVLLKIASATERKDEAPNIEPAQQIAKENDKSSVQELIENLHNKKTAIQNDCIKVLYEIGDLKPALIADHYPVFIQLLRSKNNRLQWGGMTALCSICPEKPAVIFKQLPVLAEAVSKGSVITRDQYMALLLKLCTLPEYAEDAFQLYKEELISCPSNQLPMYAENALPIINEKNKIAFIKTLRGRLNDFEKETKKKRAEKLISKLSDKK